MERNGVYEFTLNVNHSVANALRRTITANIPVLVFDTEKCAISTNTSGFTNEILKQRLGCIPIHTLDPAAERYTLTVSKRNETLHTILVTTADFVVRNEAGEEVRDLLPPTEIQLDGPMKAYFIEFMRLKPAEEFSLKCGISVRTAAQSGQYNAASLCAYGCTRDSVLAQEEWEKRPEESKSPEDKKNWDLLESKRHVKPNSFEFALKTCSAYTNRQLVLKACEIINDQLAEALIVYEEHSGATTLPNCTDVVVKGGDFTLGKLLEYQIFETREASGVTYVTFFKRHPHDADGILRVAVKGEEEVKDIVRAAIAPLTDLFTGIARTVGGKPPPAMKQFEALELDEKRKRLVAIGFDAANVAKADDDALDRMADRYMSRAEQAQKPALKEAKEAKEADKEAKEADKDAKEADKEASKDPVKKKRAPRKKKEAPEEASREAPEGTGDPSEASKEVSEDPKEASEGSEEASKESAETSGASLEASAGTSAKKKSAKKLSA